MIRNILVTGACGFIGHHIVQYLLENTQHNIYVIDKLSYASNGLDRLREIGAVDNPRVHLYIYDLVSKIDDGFIKELSSINWIMHLAAETHVDNSISDPYYSVMNNIHSTMNLLEFARKLKHLEKFLYFSTDEVYGPALGGKMFDESCRHNPTNPYSASKSASEMICRSYENTFGIPLMVCNVTNVFGERQHNEKFIPKCVKNILNGDQICIHTYPIVEATPPKSGSRFYIYAQNVASAVHFIMENGKLGEYYNIAGEEEFDNDILCNTIAEILGKSSDDINRVYIDNDVKRPNHDIRYGLDGSKLLNMGWRPSGDVNDHIKRVVEFTRDNTKWMMS
jgi:dTDP-glucose 4,6-dehydratase